MKLQVTDFYGFIKWLVTDNVAFVDPSYLSELDESILLSKNPEDKLGKN